MKRLAPHFVTLLALAATACSSMPKIQVKTYKFPKNAFVGKPEWPFETLGVVRTKVEYASLNPDWEEAALCQNYYNKAVGDLLKRAKERGADAIAHVRSVVFMVDGRSELHETAECADDGQEGQILAQAVAIKWKKSSDGLEAVKPEDTAEAAPAPKSFPKGLKEKAPVETGKIVRPGDFPVIRGD
jgi:hypothetical protein